MPSARAYTPDASSPPSGSAEEAASTAGTERSRSSNFKCKCVTQKRENEPHDVRQSRGKQKGLDKLNHTLSLGNLKNFTRSSPNAGVASLMGLIRAPGTNPNSREISS